VGARRRHPRPPSSCCSVADEEASTGTQEKKRILRVIELYQSKLGGEEAEE